MELEQLPCDAESGSKLKACHTPAQPAAELSNAVLELRGSSG